MNRVPITEIFTSLQGEGPYVGMPQVFVRFAGCNIECRYCDTKEKSKVSAIKTGGSADGGKSQKSKINNIVRKVIGLSKKEGIDTVSLTGGEPLLYSEAVREIARALRKKGFRILLETNGTLPEAFRSIKTEIDIVSMDIKLPSACGAGLWEKQRDFLRLAKTKDVYIKTVIEPDTPKREFIRALELVKKIDRKIPFILQPVTQTKKISHEVLRKCLQWYALARKYLTNVRIIPQMHVLIGIK